MTSPHFTSRINQSLSTTDTPLLAGLCLGDDGTLRSSYTLALSRSIGAEVRQVSLHSTATGGLSILVIRDSGATSVTASTIEIDAITHAIPLICSSSLEVDMATANAVSVLLGGIYTQTLNLVASLATTPVAGQAGMMWRDVSSRLRIGDTGFIPAFASLPASPDYLLRINPSYALVASSLIETDEGLTIPGDLTAHTITASSISASSLTSTSGLIEGRNLTSGTWTKLYTISTSSDDRLSLSLITLDSTTGSVATRSLILTSTSTTPISLSYGDDSGVDANAPRIVAFSASGTITMEERREKNAGISSQAISTSTLCYQPFIPRVRSTLVSVSVTLALTSATCTAIARICTGSLYNPATLVASSSPVSLTSTSPTLISFSFPTTPALTLSSAYSLGVETTSGTGKVSLYDTTLSNSPSLVAGTYIAGTATPLVDLGFDISLFTSSSTTSWDVYAIWTSPIEAVVRDAGTVMTWEEEGTGTWPSSYPAGTPLTFDTASPSTYPPAITHSSGSIYVSGVVNTNSVSASSNVVSTGGRGIFSAGVTSSNGLYVGKVITGGTWYKLYSMTGTTNDMINMTLRTKDVDSDVISSKAVMMGSSVSTNTITCTYSLESGYQSNQPRVVVFNVTNYPQVEEYNTGPYSLTIARDSSGVLWQSFTSISGRAVSSVVCYIGVTSTPPSTYLRLVLGHGYTPASTIIADSDPLTPTISTNYTYSFSTFVALIVGQEYTIVRLPAWQYDYRYTEPGVYAGGKAGVYYNVGTSYEWPNRDVAYVIYTAPINDYTFDLYVYGQPESGSRTDVKVDGCITSLLWTDEGTGTWPTDHPTGDGIVLDTDDPATYPPSLDKSYGLVTASTGLVSTNGVIMFDRSLTGGTWYKLYTLSLYSVPPGGIDPPVASLNERVSLTMRVAPSMGTGMSEMNVSVVNAFAAGGMKFFHSIEDESADGARIAAFGTATVTDTASVLIDGLLGTSLTGGTTTLLGQSFTATTTDPIHYITAYSPMSSVPGDVTAYAEIRSVFGDGGTLYATTMPVRVAGGVNAQYNYYLSSPFVPTIGTTYWAMFYSSGTFKLSYAADAYGGRAGQYFLVTHTGWNGTECFWFRVWTCSGTPSVDVYALVEYDVTASVDVVVGKTTTAPVWTSEGTGTWPSSHSAGTDVCFDTNTDTATTVRELDSLILSNTSTSMTVEGEIVSNAAGVMLSGAGSLSLTGTGTTITTAGTVESTNTTSSFKASGPIILSATANSSTYLINASVQTTNTTATAVFSLATATSHAYSVSADISFSNATASGYGEHKVFYGCSNTAGAVTNTIVLARTYYDTYSLGVGAITIDTSGTSSRILVHGVAGTTLRWTASVTVSDAWV
jgi:hypothetical protein